MAFQIKDFKSIVASMINYVRGTTNKLTDFSVGSVNRTLLEAPAIELDELYQKMFTGLREAIPAAIYPPFGFDLLQPTAAATNVTFTLAVASSTPVIIPNDFAVRAPGGMVTYLTQAQAVIPAGDTSLTVRVVADQVGSVGNAIAGSLVEMVQAISGLTLTNPAPITSGRDLETEEERTTRFQSFIQSIARSHVDGIQFGATTAQVVNEMGDITEIVQKALVVEPFISDPTQPLGYLDVYLWNGVDSASPELISEATKILNGYRTLEGERIVGYKGAGIVSRVKAVTEQYLDVQATITLNANVAINQVSTLVASALSAYIADLDIGEAFIVSEAIERIMKIEGIYNVKINLPLDDVVVTPDVKLLVGVITVGGI